MHFHPGFFQHRLFAGLLLAIPCIPLLPHVQADDAAWELIKQEQDVSVYTRPVQGSAYPEVKASTVLDAPISSVAALLGDGEGCPAWRANCKSSEVIETLSEHERYVYTVLDLPWPAKDRDMIMHSSTTTDPESLSATVILQTDSARLPPTDYVRAESRGSFFLQVIGDSQVKFTYTMHTELGGDLPAGPVSKGMVDGALADLARLRELARKR